MNENIVIVTGGFDPIHSGHIDYINSAAKLGRVVVGINSDDWLTRKKGRPFMSYTERHSIISNLKNVLCVLPFDDSDGSAIDIIKTVRKLFPKNKIIFANGGDRTKQNIPELAALEHVDNLEFVFGVGGNNKKNSSSWLLEEWKQPKTNRSWGYYRVLHEVEGCKVKELTIEPGQKISMQQHKNRNELWLISEGTAVYRTDKSENLLNKHDFVEVKKDSWHQLHNISDIPCKLVEIQYGSECVENDIIRKDGPTV